jgi:hypothetical protein
LSEHFGITYNADTLGAAVVPHYSRSRVESQIEDKMAINPRQISDRQPLFGNEPPDGPHTKLLACINFVDDHSSGCAAGYRSAAELLTKSLNAEDGWLDYLVYPIVFLWRHYLELKLKLVVNLLAKEEENPPSLLTHKLVPLWAEVEKRLKANGTDTGQDDIQLIKQRVQEFEQFDPSSEAFRFTRDRSKKSNLPNRKHVDLGILHNEMRKVADSLDGMEDWLEAMDSQAGA